MNYVITGSIGHISKPVVKKLVQAGHTVTVVTSNNDRIKDIESLGAKASVGSVEDAAFVKSAFNGAEVVYLMIPPTWAPNGQWIDYLKNVANNYVAAVKDNDIKNIVLLSSVGAHLGKGTGPVDGLAYAETKLKELKDVNIKALRPSYFFNNLLSNIPMIKHMSIMGSNFGGSDDKLIMVDTNDIADVVAEELLNLKFKGFSVRYIASDERTPKEVAEILSKAIGKPTPWIEFKDADALNGMLQSGLTKSVAEAYVEMGESLRSGKMQEDYWKNRPTLGKVKLEDFAKTFAVAFNS